MKVPIIYLKRDNRFNVTAECEYLGEKIKTTCYRDNYMHLMFVPTAAKNRVLFWLEKELKYKGEVKVILTEED